MDLRTLRTNLKLTVVQLGEIVGINPSRISQIERGLLTPSLNDDVRLRRMFGDEIELPRRNAMNVPDMPKPMWRDGKPYFADLDAEDEALLESRQERLTLAARERYEDGQGVPDPEEADKD